MPDMERKFAIAAPGAKGKRIRGFIRGSLDRPTVVFVHGFTGDMNEHQFFNAAKFLDKHGITSVRFALYYWQADTRKLHECTLATHAADLDVVIRFVRKKGAKRITVVGHSYGGKTILMSQDKDFDGVVFWDASHGDFPLFGHARYLRELDAYLEVEETPYLTVVGKKMVEEEKRLRPEGRIKDIHVPIKIICAGKGVLVRGGRKYFASANAPKAFTVISGATHCFDEEGAEEELFKETSAWVKKCSR